jgi:hypothetical protein
MTLIKTSLALPRPCATWSRKSPIIAFEAQFGFFIMVAPSADYDEELLELAAQGKVKLPDIPPTADDLAKELGRKLPRMKSKGDKAEQIIKRIWEEERGDY